MQKIRAFLEVHYQTIFLAALVAVFLVLFSILAIKGSYSRYNQDDYCYGYRFQNDNFLKAQIISYFQPAEYNTDRYSLTMLNGSAELLGGPKFARVYPSIVMILWIFILAYLLNISLMQKRNLLITITSVFVIVFYVFILAPNKYQNLYWISTVNTYTVPVILTTLILGRILHFAFTRKFTILNVFELFLLTLLAGGFSEVTTMWELAVWVCALATLFLFWKKTLFVAARKPLFMTMISSILAIIIMYVNPKSMSNPPHPFQLGLVTYVGQTLLFTEEFIRQSIKSAPVAFAAIFFLGIWLSLQKRSDDAQSVKKLFVQLLTILALLYILCMAVIGAYLLFTGVYPGDRALLPAHFCLILGVFLSGWTIADLLVTISKKMGMQRGLVVASSQLGLLLLVYLFRSISVAADKLPLFEARAQAWDARQEMILDAKAKGESNITVPAFESIYGITELQPNHDNWVNKCAARYYRVDTITAEDGYMGYGSYSIGR